jgi:hypothetical protein
MHEVEIGSGPGHLGKNMRSYLKNNLKTSNNKSSQTTAQTVKTNVTVDFR